MKRNNLFRSLVAASLLLLGTTGIMATTVVHTFTAASSSGIIDDNITFTTAKNDAGTTPNYTTELRLYYSANGNGGSITLIPATGFVINEVKVTSSGTTYTPPVKYNVDGERDLSVVWDGVNYTITGIAATSSVRMRNATVPNVQFRLKSLEVTYSAIDVNAPAIKVTEVLVPEMMAKVGASVTENITVNATNLTGDINLAVTGANAANFTVTPATITPVAGAVTNATVVVTYSPLVANEAYSALLTLSSTGATAITRSLVGGTIPNQLTPPNVIITEAYGGGNNAGAKYKNDFIELYNTTLSDIDISGWGVQYYSATAIDSATVTNRFEIPAGKKIPGGGYFLIECATGTTVAPEYLPTPDAVSTLSLAAGAGKVALYTADGHYEIPDLASIINNPAFKDFLPYGNVGLTPIWGTAMASNLSNILSASRVMIDGVYSYTQTIGYDFETSEPYPQNSLMTSVKKPQLSNDIVAVNGTIRFEGKAGQLVEVYNVMGQKIVTTRAIDGQNILPLKEKGIMMVKVGNKVAKVII